jgi:hypothetical protein
MDVGPYDESQDAALALAGVAQAADLPAGAHRGAAVEALRQAIAAAVAAGATITDYERRVLADVAAGLPPEAVQVIAGAIARGR